MESDLGKLFIGGISWDTNEDRLREYFKTFGDVLEAVIMKDRQTGRARGFGFVVFADPAVAERVVMEKHTIDGRTVEAKKAVPRDDQQILSRSLSSSIHASPGPSRTKKIFVGGLASSVTEADFKKYFDQFGIITDVVVMYDHNTQRPRGFGFITFDSEDSVDRVLLKTFHELNGKMVEVKRAVPKELSPGPNRSPLPGYNNYALNRINNFLNGSGQGYGPNSIGGYGLRMDSRFGPIGRSVYPSFGPPGYGLNINFEPPNLNPNIGLNASFSSNIGLGRGLNPYYSGNSSRYNNAISYAGGNGGSGSFMNSPGRNVWGNGGLNYPTTSISSTSFMGSGSGSIEGFGNRNVNWSNSPSIPTQGGIVSSGFGSGNINYGNGDNSSRFGVGSYGRSNVETGIAPASYNATDDAYERNYTDLYGGASVYGDRTWSSATSELDGSGSFGYGFNNAASDAKNSAGYIGGHSVTGRQPNRGIAA